MFWRVQITSALKTLAFSSLTTFQNYISWNEELHHMLFCYRILQCAFALRQQSNWSFAMTPIIMITSFKISLQGTSRPFLSEYFIHLIYINYFYRENKDAIYFYIATVIFFFVIVFRQKDIIMWKVIDNINILSIINLFFQSSYSNTQLKV